MYTDKQIKSLQIMLSDLKTIKLGEGIERTGGMVQLLYLRWS